MFRDETTINQQYHYLINLREIIKNGICHDHNHFVTLINGLVRKNKLQLYLDVVELIWKYYFVFGC